ncbi:MAG: DUF58 domain-containing protein [Oscillospiraceae bacterium]|jgi:hypothetical protein|nr:DUF58 domain-containing protein [Oscillospiraceae bacterium]
MIHILLAMLTILFCVVNYVTEINNKFINDLFLIGTCLFSCIYIYHICRHLLKKAKPVIGKIITSCAALGFIFILIALNKYFYEIWGLIYTVISVPFFILIAISNVRLNKEKLKKTKGIRKERNITKIIQYLFLLFFAVIFYVMYIGDFALVLLVFIALMPLLFFLILKILKRNVTFGLNLSSKYELKGSPFSVILTIDNPTHFPVSRAIFILKYTNIFSDFETYESFEIPIKAKTTQQLNCTVGSEHCGIFTVTLCEVRFYDYVRFFSVSKKLSVSVSNKIIPAVSDLNSLIESTDIENESEKLSEYEKGDDPSQIFDLRDYVEGDKLNKIHWKLTVKEDRTIIKEYSQSISAGYALLFDFNTDSSMTSIDTLLETLYDIAYFLIANEKTLKVCYFAGSYEELEIISENDLTFLSEIFIAKFNSSGLAEKFIENNAYNIFSHVIYICENATEETVNFLDNIENTYKKSILAINSNIENNFLYTINPAAISSSLEAIIF